MEEQEGGSGAWMEEEGDWEKSLSSGVGCGSRGGKGKLQMDPILCYDNANITNNVENSSLCVV